MAAAGSTYSLTALADLLQGAARPIDYGPSLKLVAIYLAAQSKRAFDEGRAPDGTPWLPLQRPRSGKRHQGSSPKPLRDTGLLMASLGRGAPQHVEETTPTTLTFGTAVDYSSYHQDGTRFIPARPFLGVTPAMEERIGEIVADQVARQLARAFGG